MRKYLVGLIGSSVLLLGAAGCATMEGSDKAEDARVAGEAPLGSRIKRRTEAAPVLGASREDLEMAKVQQGAIQTGMVNNPTKYGGR